MASFKRVRQVIAYGLTSIVAIVTIVTSSLQTAAAQESNNPLALGAWLDGVPTRYVSEVLFEDTDFNRYRPYANPYAAITHALENMPAEKLDLAVSRYGTSIPEGLAPFHSLRKPFGTPGSHLFQQADYYFKDSCSSCPERVSLYSDSVGIRYRAEGANAKPGSGQYVAITFGEMSASHFEKYPFLREVLELHALMLNGRNPQSYIYRRERAIHHGLQAVLSFVESRRVRLSPYAEKTLKETASLSLNDRIAKSLKFDIQRETGINPNAKPGGWERVWNDSYPYQSPTGKSVLVKAILDSIFAEGSAKERAIAIRENYEGRVKYANYEFAEFRNNMADYRKDLGPRPPYVKALKWWDDMNRWLPTNRVSLIVPTCEGSFIRM